MPRQRLQRVAAAGLVAAVVDQQRRAALARDAGGRARRRTPPGPATRSTTAPHAAPRPAAVAPSGAGRRPKASAPSSPSPTTRSAQPVGRAHELARGQAVEQLVGDQQQRRVAGQPRRARSIQRGAGARPPAARPAGARERRATSRPARARPRPGSRARAGRRAATSLISVPSPGPTSTSSTRAGAPMRRQVSTAQSPISSPNICETSGAVMKSPSLAERRAGRVVAVAADRAGSGSCRRRRRSGRRRRSRPSAAHVRLMRCGAVGRGVGGCRAPTRAARRRTSIIGRREHHAHGQAEREVRHADGRGCARVSSSDADQRRSRSGRAPVIAPRRCSQCSRWVAQPQHQEQHHALPAPPRRAGSDGAASSPGRAVRRRSPGDVLVAEDHAPGDVRRPAPELAVDEVGDAAEELADRLAGRDQVGRAAAGRCWLTRAKAIRARPTPIAAAVEAHAAVPELEDLQRIGEQRRPLAGVDGSM